MQLSNPISIKYEICSCFFGGGLGATLAGTAYLFCCSESVLV